MRVMDLSHPTAIAERGEEIYNRRYRADYEAEHRGSFVAIDVLSETAYLGDTAEAAMQSAQKDAPSGVFHLMKVGALGAFKVSRTRHQWITL